MAPLPGHASKAFYPRSGQLGLPPTALLTFHFYCLVSLPGLLLPLPFHPFLAREAATVVNKNPPLKDAMIWKESGKMTPGVCWTGEGALSGGSEEATGMQAATGGERRLMRGSETGR